MKPLQMRFYSNREMTEAMGLDLHDHNFSQKAGAGWKTGVMVLSSNLTGVS